MDNKCREILEALCSRDRTDVLVVCEDPERGVLDDFISEVGGLTGGSFKVTRLVSKIENLDTGTRVYFWRYNSRMIEDLWGSCYRRVILLTSPTDYDKSVINSRIRPHMDWDFWNPPHWFSEYRDTWLEKASD